MAFYYAYIHKNTFGEISVDKLGHRDYEKPLSLISFGDFLSPDGLKDGIYIVESKEIPGIDTSIIPCVPVFSILKEENFDLRIFGERVYEEGKDYEETMYEEYNWSDLFFDKLLYVVDCIQNHEYIQLSVLLKRWLFRNPNYLEIDPNGDLLAQKIMNGDVKFQSICEDVFTPVLPDPSRSVLVPKNRSSHYEADAIYLTDINSIEGFSSDADVVISSKEDIEKWKSCFKDFFTIEWNYDHPELIFDRDKGVSIGEINFGGRRKECIEYTFFDACGEQRRLIVRF